MNFVDQIRIKLKNKDEINIKKSEKRLISTRMEDIIFSKEVTSLHIILTDNAMCIADILEQYLEHPTINIILKEPFSKSKIVSILQDKGFTAFLMQANLFKRTITMSLKTNSQIKLRVYFAILNYDNYKKQRWAQY